MFRPTSIDLLAPVCVDIQKEDAVKQAVEEAVATFGGIDTLINNASAIHLTGTLETPMKRYDLMHSINTRGTFLCSKYCLPHLKKSPNPHILNISPPLSMKPKWFKDNVAYTMAKYGMSMCALGMAEEFRADGVAVNTLWPRTAIYTAVMAMLGGGEAVKPQCRTPEIMSDAAYAILTRDSRSFTGNFCVDDDILKEEGMTDFTKYNYVENPTLLPDFFLEEAGDREQFLGQLAQQGGKPKDFSQVGSELENTFKAVEGLLSADLVKTVNGVFVFDLGDAGSFYLDLKNGNGAAGKGPAPQGEANVNMILNAENFVKMFAGKLNPTTAFMSGKLKIKGDLGMAMKLEKIMKQTRSQL
ncbi:hypothetical protein CAPTEDRAFT_166703 [Capitella teleta]|uniref:Hydroxysteroid dehydrogenase-like protein 2 n=1 Tax=Capitella teleta TaxID=283909 RepID=R7VM60_CAPTE|nr:hypothetical protein CAPTEDRAFT_166703 [Capitella teleta]|eukprot:ELU18275.1 hypothetical protein CAPTEDRAFT_166703 [Capitella teleta]